MRRCWISTISTSTQPSLRSTLTVRVTCSIHGEKVQILTASVEDKAEGFPEPQGSPETLSSGIVMVPSSVLIGILAEVEEVGSRRSRGEIVAVAVVVTSPIFPTLVVGPGEGDGVSPVEVGNEGVGRARRVRCGNASLVQ